MLRDLACTAGCARVERVTSRLESPKDMATSLHFDNYRRFVNIPAYYDPNECVVHLNATALEKNSAKTLFIICYHELIHGASQHRNYQDNDENIFQSGIKIEKFRHGGYSCVNRLLNEGIVQYLTNHYNQVSDTDYAYHYEAALVRKVAQDLSLGTVKQAILYDAYDEFIDRFEAYYGPRTFHLFSHWIDKRKYQKAEALIASQPQRIITYQHYQATVEV